MDITKIAKVILSAEDKTAPATSSAKKNVQGVGSAVDMVRDQIARLGALIGVGMFTGAVKNAIDAADALNDMARKTGVAVEVLGGLQYAFSKAGVDAATLEKSMVKLSANMAEVAGGNKELIATFNAIGVSVRDAQGNLKSTDQMLLDLADRFSELQDSPEKTALALKALGKAGADLISGLDEGSESIRAAIEEYQRYGGITADVAAAADTFNDTVAKLQLMFSALFRQIAAAVLPTLQTLANQFAETKNTADGFKVIAEGVAVVLKMLASVAVGVVAAFKAAGSAIGSVFAAIELAVRGDFKGAMAAVREGFADVSVSAREAVQRMSAIWSSETAVIAAKTEENVRNKPRAAIAAMVRDSAREIQKLTDQFNALVSTLNGQDLGIDSSFAAKFALLTRAYNGEIKGVILSLEQYRELVQKLLDQQPFAKRQREELEKLIKVEEEYLAIQKKQSEEATASLGAYAEENDRRALEVHLIGQSNLVRERALIIADAELVKQKLIAAGDVKGLEILEELIKKRLELAEITDSKSAALAYQGAWLDAISNVATAGADFIVDFVQHGRSAFRNLWDSFRTWGLRVLAEIAARRVVVSLVGVASPGLASAAGAQPTNLVDMLAGGGGGGGIGSLLSGIPGLGSLFGGGFSAALGAGFSAGLETLSLAATAGLEAIGGLSSALGALGAVAGPVGLAISGIALAASLLMKEGGGPKSGGFAGVGDITGIRDTDSTGRWFTPSGEDATVRAIVEATSKSYTDLLRQLGGAGGAAFALGFDTDPEGDAPNRVHAGTFVDGRQVYDAALGDLGRDPAVLQAALETEAKRSLLAALQASDLPDYLANLFDNIEVGTATTEQIDNLIATATALKLVVAAAEQLGPAFASLKPEDIQALAEAFGGLDAFVQSAAFINQNFTTSSVRLATATQDLQADFEALGFAVPDTHQAFLDLLATIPLTTEEGRNMYAAVSALAPAFVAVKGNADQAAEAAQALASKLGEAISQNFVTAAERQADAQEALTKAFGASVPKTHADFIAMVKTMGVADDQVLELVDAFVLLHGSAQDAAEAIANAWSFFDTNFYSDTEQAATRIESAWKRIHDAWTDTGEQLLALGYDHIPTTNAAFRAFIETLRSAGLTDLANQLVTLGPTIIGLNGDIATLAGTAQEAGNAIASAAEQIAQGSSQLTTLYQDEFTKLLQGIDAVVSQSGGGYGEKLALRINLIKDSIANFEKAIAQYPAGSNSATITLYKQFIDKLTAMNTAATAQLARFVELTLQYGEAKAGELAALEEWWQEQQRIYQDYPVLLDALRVTFEERWQAIINGVSEGVDGALSEFKRLQQGIRDYLNSLTIGELSPLTPTQKLAEAKRQYEELLAKAQGGDLEALAKITQAAEAYLKIARDYYASSTTGYGSIFTAVTSALEQLATMEQLSTPTHQPPDAGALLAPVLPTKGRMVSDEDLNRELEAHGTKLAVAFLEGLNALAESAHKDSEQEQYQARILAVRGAPLK